MTELIKRDSRSSELPMKSTLELKKQLEAQGFDPEKSTSPKSSSEGYGTYRRPFGGNFTRDRYEEQKLPGASQER